MTKICPSCGKREEAGEFVSSFCADCFASRSKSFELPTALELRVCNRCGRARISGEWSAFSDKVLVNFVASKLREKAPTQLEQTSVSRVKNGFAVNMLLSSLHAGKKVSRNARVSVRVDKTPCPNCLMHAGGYHEAVVQIRGDMERCRKFSVRLRKLVEKTSFVTGIEEKKEGIDLLVGSRPATMQALSKIGKTFTKSNKLIGMRDGQRVYRVTALVRL